MTTREMTDTFTKLAAEDLERLFTHRPALIIGPDATAGSASVLDFDQALAGRFKVDPIGSPWETCDSVLAAEQGTTDELIDASIEFWSSTSMPPEFYGLARIRWASVISFAFDDNFERAFNDWLAKNPARGGLATIANFHDTVPPRFVPSFKLLGLARDRNLALTQNDLEIRVAQWSHFLAEHTDRARGSTTICVGVGTLSVLLFRLFASMIANPRYIPSSVAFFESDPVLRESRLQELTRRGLRVLSIAETAANIAKVYEKRAQHGGTLPLSYSGTTLTPIQALEEFDDIAIYVPANVEPQSSRDARRLHVDILFSPSSLRWDPFAFELDFPRTVTKSLRSLVDDAAKDVSNDTHAIVAIAPAASGKTTILKRIAFDLAKDGTHVLWFRQYTFQDGPSRLKRLVDSLIPIGKDDPAPLVVFVDDPVALGGLALSDIVEAFDDSPLSVVYVTALRTSDYDLYDPAIGFGRRLTSVIEELPLGFDDTEIQQLPQYLCDLRIARDLSDAQTRVRNAASSDAGDVLSSLFMLVPESRHSITQSVTDEFFRLGDRKLLTEFIVGEVNHTTDLLKRAYEYVACGEKYAYGVPIEVLVSALDVSYTDWINATDTEGPAWGLLYTESSSISESIVYRTRNSVVRDIVVQAVNGGVMSRSGELDRLGQLLDGCTGTSPAYREFVLQALVSRDNNQLRSLTYSEVDTLFERALDALPYDDPTLLHHRGIWQRKKGNPTTARETLQRALKSPRAPYSERGEAPEHIHTSIASTIRDQIREGEVSVDQGTEDALAHLEKAKSEEFLNPRATYVQATLIASLADLQAQELSPDFFGLVNRALAEIDRMLLILDSSLTDREGSAEAKRKLDNQRGEILDRVFSGNDLVPIAEQMWESSRRIDGFIVIARRLYQKARESNKGRAYNEAWDYCQNLAHRLADQKLTLPEPLAELMLLIKYRWQVKRQQFSGITGGVDWMSIRTLAEVVVDFPDKRDDPFYQYLLAVALAHTDDWNRAEAIFGRLRSMRMYAGVKFELRDYLMFDEGGMRRIEGRMQSGHDGKRYVESSELHCALPADRNENWPADGEIVNCYVHFRFAGPQAARNP